MTASQVRAFQQALPPGQRPRDAQQLARALVNAGKLTRYQAAVLYQGNSDGLVLGNYTVLDRIGAGGMGQVFKAVHRRMDRIVALKVLPPHFARSPENRRRFEREVKAAARLAHPHIVAAYDADSADKTDFFVMELVEGPNLAELVRDQGPLEVAEAAGYVLQAARGLAYAHAQGIVHRDIKPANLLLAPDGSIKVLDLGLARFHEVNVIERQQSELTTTGQVVGTVEYMPPEQAVDTRQADRRADIYALGCTLFRLLTGELPYPGDTPVQIILAHRDQPIPAINRYRDDVPRALESVFRRMVAKDPDERYQTMEEVISALTDLGHTGRAIRPKAALVSPPMGGANSNRAAVEATGDLDHADCVRSRDPSAGCPRKKPSRGRSPEKRRTPAPAGSRRPSALLVGTGLFAFAVVSACFSLLSNDRLSNDQPSNDNSVGAAVESTAPGSLARPTVNEIRAWQRQRAEQLGLQAFHVNFIGMRFALVPRGQLRSPAAGMSRDVYVALHEVTVGEFSAFVARTGYRTQAEEAALIGHTPMSRARANEPMMTWRRPGTFTQSDRHPVVCVSVRDAEAFCRWLSDMDGTIHRLPTANEWDYVANVGGTSSGSAFEPPDAVMGSNNIPFRTRRAGLGDVNPLGLIDLHGNVAEWCQDNPDAPIGVIRGGLVEGQSPEGQSSEAWNDEAQSATWFHSHVGFRVVQLVPGG